MRRKSRTYKGTCYSSAIGFSRFFFLIFLLLVSTSMLHGQQIPILTQYMVNPMAYNPGFAGNNAGICINGIYREQWLGFKDDAGIKVAPRDIFLTVDAPIRKIHGAIGGVIISDRVGFFENYNVKVGYTFRTDLWGGELGVGAHLNLQTFRLDFAKFKDHVIDPDDPLLQESGETTDLTIDADLGLYFEVPDRYYIGLSGLQLIQSKAKNIHYQQRRTLILTGGYNFVIPNHPLFELKPSAIILYDFGAFQFAVSALLAYNKKFYGGLQYRFQDAIAIIVGMQIKGLRIGVSYDINTSALSRYNSGSVEVSLGYCFKMKLEKFRKRYKNTRFL